MTTTPGSVVAGRYRLINQIAVGGMGSVWEAWDELLLRPVALKQLLPQPGLTGPDAILARDRVIREARITARLHHPHAVTLFDVVEQDGRPCLVMQYVPSRSLNALLHEKGALPPAFVARIGSEVAAALAAAHQAGIVHRDVKPGNVLITEDGSAKLTDFGISHAAGDASLTSTGMVTGTPAFLAPEVARGAKSSYSSDVFSLGATLYAALEGTPPFGTDPNPMAMLHKVASGQMNAPQRSGPLTALLLRMLAAEPGDRPAMIEVARALAAHHAEAQAQQEVARRWAVSGPTPTMRIPAGASPIDTPAFGQPAVQTTPPSESSGPQESSTPQESNAPPELSAPSQSGTPAPEIGTPPGSGPPPNWGRPPPEFDASAARAAAPGSAEPEPAGPRRRLPGALIAGIVGVILAAAIAAGFLLLRPGDNGGTAQGSTSTATPPASSSVVPSTTSSVASTSSARSSSVASTPSSSVASTPSSSVASTPSSSVASTPSSSVASARPSSVASTRPSSVASTRSSSVASSTASRSASTAAPTAAELAGAVTGYYALMPGNTDQGWARLTAHFQSSIAQNRQYYENFWDSVQSVSVADAKGVPPGTVEATITYRFKDGSVSVERTSYELVRDQGVLKIDNSTVQ